MIFISIGRFYPPDFGRFHPSQNGQSYPPLTMIYLRADNRLKAEAINKVTEKIVTQENFQDWSKDKDLMEYLSALGRK